MSNFANDMDWTKDDGFNPPGFDASATATAEPAGFFIPEFDADVDVDQIEQEAADSKYQDPPIGPHTFVITGFREDPKRVSKSGYLPDRTRVDYVVGSVRVKLAVVGQRNLTISDYVEFPMGTRADLAAFKTASKGPDGKGAGFMYRKFMQFLKRIGYAIVDGQPIPKEALALNDWVGKEVVATVKMGRKQVDPTTQRPKCNPSTGEEYPARAEIELMSYRAAESTLVAQAERESRQADEAVAAMAASSAAPRQPQRPQGSGMPVERPTPRTAAEFVQSGLANL